MWPFRKWTFVKNVTARSTRVDGGYYVGWQVFTLLESGNKRKYICHGRDRHNDSPQDLQIKAAVSAWIGGGPLPQCASELDSSKSLPPHHRKGNVIYLTAQEEVK